MKTRQVLKLAAAGVLGLAGVAAVAQEPFPSKPIRIIIGFAPGGPLDSVARALAPGLSEEFKQPVVVENRPGASGLIASDAVARSAPDGNTWALVGITHSILAAVRTQLAFDPAKDFTPLAIVGWGPLVLAVNPSVPANNVAELVALSKTTKLAYGTPGGGTSPHIAIEMIKRASGADFVHIPYKGSALAMTDAIAGNVQILMDVVPTALPQVRAGKLRPLAVSGKKRIAELPDVPTIAEAGYPNADLTTWWGIVGPARIPKPVVERINAALMKVLQTPEVRARYVVLGGDPTGTSSEEFGRILSNDIARFTSIVKDARITTE